MISFMKRYSGFFLLVIGIIGLMILNIIEVSASPTTQVTTSSLTNSQVVESMDMYFFVDIKGEVVYPAVYQVKAGTRIEEVIMMAGGLTNRSDITEVNLAKMVYDQMVIYIPSSQVAQLGEDSPREVFVDIKGAVRYPGVYKVPSNFRVYDAIMRAGGFIQDSDSSQLNLSEIVTDQMVIFIPNKIVNKLPESNKTYIYVEITGEVMKPGLYRVEDTLLIKDVINLAGGVKTTADISKINLNQGIVNQLSIFIPAINTSTTPENNTDSEETNPTSNKININTATVDILDTLPGIGYIIAQRIIDYRAEYGNFESIEDVMNVSGIKEAIYAEIKDLICV